MNDKSYNYSVGFEAIEVITKGIKKYLVKGYFSTIDEDLSTETITMEGQKDILKQVKGRIITFDTEHEIFYDSKGEPLPKPSSNMPIAKVVDAELDVEGKYGKKGVYGTVEFNIDAPRFKNLWASVKNKFLHSFSVAFYPIEAIKKNINGVYKSFVNKLNLVNITLTGAPMNPNATFTPVMKSAVNGLLDSFNTYDVNHNTEVNNVTEQEKEIVVEAKEEAIVNDAPVKEVVKPAEEPVVEASEEPEKKAEPVVDFKSIVASLKAEFKKDLDESKEALNAELKALNDKIIKLEEQPIKKSLKGDNTKILGEQLSKEATIYDLM